jgi:lipoyl(octanoyl) transferase
MCKSKYNINVEWKTSEELINYNFALATMEERITQIANGQANELVWLLEHPSLYTAGSSSESSELLQKNDIEIFETGRGGKYTYHGPGQRVIYLMLNLSNRGSDLHKYIASLEDWLISCFNELGLHSFKRAGRVGIWVFNSNHQEVKIAAIGIRVRKWVSFHGIAINVNPDLSYYNNIIPCGIKEYGVSSLKELGINVTYAKLDEILKRKFDEYF